MEYQGISKLDLKRRNRMQILKVIKECGPISRVDIASALEITRAAVTIITNEMIEEGVLYEVGEAPVSLENLQKGRRKIPIDIDSNFKFAVGASISENGVSVGLSNLKPEVLDKNFLDISEETTYEEIVDFIVNETKRMLQNSCLDLSKILGLGISVQPELCSKMKVYFKDGKLDFTNLTETFTKELNMPVVCMNSISALALANQETNIEDRSGNYLFIKFGKNINASILLENEVMHEYLNHTNQIERAICKPNGKKLDGYPDGSVKAELTRDAVIAKYAAILSKEETPILWEATEGDINNINYKTITAAASKGEAKVLEVLNSIIECIAILINNISTVLFAKFVVLHGFFMNEWLFDYFKNYISDFCGEDIAKKIKISRAENKFEFTSGCAISIYEYFYKKGGI